MPKQLITIQDLAKLRVVGDPQISPDGARVVFTVKDADAAKNKYWTHLWLYQDGETRQFTFGEVSDTSPRWSPDGRRIAFLRNKDKRAQIWTMDADGGEPIALTKLPEGNISELRWSPDGTRLAFCFRPTRADWTQDATKQRGENGKSNPPRVITRIRFRFDGVGFLDERTHIWICDAQTGEAKQITTGDYEDASPAWSPDGKTIAFASNRNADRERVPQRVDIHRVSARGGAAKKIRAPAGPKSALAFSPDGKWIAYIGYALDDNAWKPRNDRVWVVARNGGKARCLTAKLDRTVGNETLADSREVTPMLPLWSRDSKRIFFPVSDAGNVHLYTAEVKSARLTPLTRGANEVAGVSVSADGKRFALTLGEPTRPVELFVGEFSGKNLRTKRVTDLNGEWLKDKLVSKPEEFWLRQKDGTRIQGWVLRPPDFKHGKKYPALTYVHGGPHSQYGNIFFYEMQAHAARGYVVVLSNGRGSNGRDENFGAAIFRDYGNLDYQDVMAIADYAARLPYVNQSRMAIAGGSYGGFMVNWVVGHTARFKCAITDRSICNWLSKTATDDLCSPPDGRWTGNAWEETAEMWRMSPLKYAANVQTPVLIIHSEGDLRCPISQAEEWFSALKWLKQNVVMVRYPRETAHGMSRAGPLDLRMDRVRRIGEWLDEHLKKR